MEQKKEIKKVNRGYVSRTVDRGVFYAPVCPEVVIHKDFGNFWEVLFAGDRASGKYFCLGNIRSNDAHKGNQSAFDYIYCALLDQTVARSRDHHGVEYDILDAVFLNLVCNKVYYLCRVKHTDLDGICTDVR